MKRISDFRVVVTSFVVSISDVVLNLLVALITGSTVMLSQALQGFSDLITGGILFVGVKRSKRGRDAEFQFGYGRELFFWVLIAAIVMFVGTGLTSFILGYQQFINPDPIDHIWLAFIMLTIGLSSNGYAFYLSVRRLRQQNSTSGRSWLRHFLSSSIIETKATFIIDFLGTLAAVFGLIALGLYVITGIIALDGLGSMMIGLAMMSGAMFLLRDVRDLIVGKAVDTQTTQQITGAAESIKGVNDVLDLRTMYLGSERLLVVLEVHLVDHLSTDEIEAITDEIKQQVKRLVPIVHHIQVEIETPGNSV